MWGMTKHSTTTRILDRSGLAALLDPTAAPTPQDRLEVGRQLERENDTWLDELWLREHGI